MRRRLLLAIVGLLAGVLFVLAVPLGIVVQRGLTDRSLDQLEARVAIIADVLDDDRRAERELAGTLEAAVGRDGLALALYTAAGRGFTFTQGDVEVVPGEVVEAAAVTGLARAREDRMLKVASRVARGGQADLVVYGQVPDDDLRTEVRRAWLLLGGILLGVLTLGAVAASVLGDRFGRPLDLLAAAARRLGDGDFTSRAPRSGLEEVDAIGAALDTTADRLGAAVARSQAFAGDASHQLRTPLTALRLQLETAEALVGGGREGARDVAASLADALGEVERLEATIGELVQLTELGHHGRAVDLRDLAEERLASVRGRAAAAGRELVLRATPTPPVVVRRGAVGQALDVLLDNALDHGAGRVTVVVAPSGSGARLAVHDQGGSLPDDVATRVGSGAGRDRAGGAARGPLPLRGGRGLLLARALVEAEGGRLRADNRGGDLGPGTLVGLLLPTADRSAVRTTTVPPVRS